METDYWMKVWEGCRLEIANKIIWYNEFITEWDASGMSVSLMMSKGILEEVRKHDEDLHEHTELLVLGIEDSVSFVTDFMYVSDFGLTYLTMPKTKIANAVVDLGVWEEEDIGIRIELDEDMVSDTSIIDRMKRFLN